MIAGGEDVGEQHEVGLVLLARRQLQTVEVGVGNAQILRLPARPGPHGDVAVGATGEAGIDGLAEPGESLYTVGTEPAGDIEGHDHAVALLERGDALAEFLDDPHVLVAEDDAGLRGGTAFVHVQVGPAYRGGGDSYDHIVRMLDRGLVDVLDRHTERFLVHDGFHAATSARDAHLIATPVPPPPLLSI